MVDDDPLFSSRDSVDIVIDGCRLVKTCSVCPEQYDVYSSSNSQIGYLRLRHGYFSAECPDVGGTLVYSAYTRGDGCFDDDERLPQLTAAVLAICAHWKNLMEEQNVRKRGCKRSCSNLADGNSDSCNRVANCAGSEKLGLPVPGLVHPSAYAGDILSQLRNWRSRHIAHTAELMDMAIAEIVRLRKLSFRYAARLSRADAEINELKSQLNSPPAFDL
jgi:hypothetical protein